MHPHMQKHGMFGFNTIATKVYLQNLNNFGYIWLMSYICEIEYRICHTILFNRIKIQINNLIFDFFKEKWHFVNETLKMKTIMVLDIYKHQKYISKCIIYVYLYVYNNYTICWLIIYIHGCHGNHAYYGNQGNRDKSF